MTEIVCKDLGNALCLTTRDGNHAFPLGVPLVRIFFALLVPLACDYCGLFRNFGEGLLVCCACTFYHVNGFIKKFVPPSVHVCQVCKTQRFLNGVFRSCTCVRRCREALQAAGVWR